MSDFEELNPQERELALALQRRLRESEQLDYVSEHKLRAARARALADAPPRRRGAWIAGGSLTAAALIAALSLGMLRPQPSALPDTEVADSQQLEALDDLTDDNDPEFYEDLDLYRWLAPAPAHA